MPSFSVVHFFMFRSIQTNNSWTVRRADEFRRSFLLLADFLPWAGRLDGSFLSLDPRSLDDWSDASDWLSLTVGEQMTSSGRKAGLWYVYGLLVQSTLEPSLVCESQPLSVCSRPGDVIGSRDVIDAPRRADLGRWSDDASESPDDVINSRDVSADDVISPEGVRDGLFVAR